jgi:branched-chain amino acid transport system substrate-binding protein
MRTAFWLVGATALALAQPAMAANAVKIGFVSTFSGPTAAVGNTCAFVRLSDHLGRKMGGKPVEVISRTISRTSATKTELVQSDRSSSCYLR